MNLKKSKHQKNTNQSPLPKLPSKSKYQMKSKQKQIHNPETVKLRSLVIADCAGEENILKDPKMITNKIHTHIYRTLEFYTENQEEMLCLAAGKVVRETR